MKLQNDAYRKLQMAKSFKASDCKRLSSVSCFCCFIDLELKESEREDKIKDNFNFVLYLFRALNVLNSPLIVGIVALALCTIYSSHT